MGVEEEATACVRRQCNRGRDTTSKSHRPQRVPPLRSKASLRRYPGFALRLLRASVHDPASPERSDSDTFHPDTARSLSSYRRLNQVLLLLGMESSKRRRGDEGLTAYSVDSRVDRTSERTKNP